MSNGINKDTIYIDVDDEITGIIDKVRESKEKVIALVLPKRAATLQSVVNMKLLKRTADAEKKRIVLITSEAGLMPLAGSVGLYVAKTLQSKPEIPMAPDTADETDTIDEPVDMSSEPGEFDVSQASEKPVGELAGLPIGPSTGSKGMEDTIDLGDVEPAAAVVNLPEAKTDKKSAKKEKKLRVPDFIKFRRLLIGGAVLLVILIIVAIILGKVLPKATVNIQTNNSTVSTNLSLNLDTATKTLDVNQLSMPTVAQTQQKTNTQQVSSTGQQNNGTPATGSVTMSAGPCTGTPPQDVSAGRGISNNGLTFITQSNTTFQPILNDKHTSCTYQATGPTAITAQSGGAQYNNLSGTFTVAGRPEVTATASSPTSGGTDDIKKIVSQADIDSATKQIAAQDSSAVKQSLIASLQKAGLYPIPGTFNAGPPTTSASPSVGTQADSVTVSQVITYSMLGIQQADLKTVVDNNIKSQINVNQQSIISDGIDQASTNVLSQSSANQAQVSVHTKAQVGTKIDPKTVKVQIVGKKAGDVQTLLKTYPGVTNVTVHLSPFWVTTIPSNTSKVTIIIQNLK